MLEAPGVKSICSTATLSTTKPVLRDSVIYSNTSAAGATGCDRADVGDDVAFRPLLPESDEQVTAAAKAVLGRAGFPRAWRAE